MQSDELQLHQHLTRRKVLLLGVAGSITALPLGGCVFLFLRLFVGRGLAGTLARAARVGRATSALTFGRGIAIGARLAPTRTVAFTRGSILGPRQQLVANFESSATESKVLIEKSPVFFSRKTRYGFDHSDYNGPCGRSIFDTEGNIIRHQTDDGIVVAIDRLNKIRRVVEHLNPDGSKIGESRYDTKSSDVIISSDSAAVESINNIRNNLGLQCPETKLAYDDWLAYKNKCGDGNTLACREISSKSEIYNRLRDQCAVIN